MRKILILFLFGLFYCSLVYAQHAITINGYVSNIETTYTSNHVVTISRNPLGDSEGRLVHFPPSLNNGYIDFSTFYKMLQAAYVNQAPISFGGLPSQSLNLIIIENIWDGLIQSKNFIYGVPTPQYITDPFFSTTGYVQAVRLNITPAVAQGEIFLSDDIEGKINVRAIRFWYENIAVMDKINTSLKNV